MIQRSDEGGKTWKAVGNECRYERTPGSDVGTKPRSIGGRSSASSPARKNCPLICPGRRSSPRSGSGTDPSSSAARWRAAEAAGARPQYCRVDSFSCNGVSNSSLRSSTLNRASSATAAFTTRRHAAVPFGSRTEAMSGFRRGSRKRAPIFRCLQRVAKRWAGSPRKVARCCYACAGIAEKTSRPPMIASKTRSLGLMQKTFRKATMRDHRIVRRKAEEPRRGRLGRSPKKKTALLAERGLWGSARRLQPTSAAFGAGRSRRPFSGRGARGAFGAFSGRGAGSGLGNGFLAVSSRPLANSIT